MARARRSFTKEYKAEVVKLIRTTAAHQDILELGACNCNTREIRLL